MTPRQMIRPLWLVGALLMMLDGLTTYLALSHVDGAREGNPVGVWAIDHLGVPLMCTLKVLIGVVMVWRLAAIADRGHRYAWLNIGLRGRMPEDKVKLHAVYALTFTLLVMGVVVGSNLHAIVGAS